MKLDVIAIEELTAQVDYFAEGTSQQQLQTGVAACERKIAKKQALIERHEEALNDLLNERKRYRETMFLPILSKWRKKPDWRRILDRRYDTAGTYLEYRVAAIFVKSLGFQFGSSHNHAVDQRGLYFDIEPKNRVQAERLFKGVRTILPYIKRDTCGQAWFSFWQNQHNELDPDRALFLIVSDLNKAHISLSDNMNSTIRPLFSGKLDIVLEHIAANYAYDWDPS